MVIVGLTGGVASGKSFVAQCLEELGAQRIDADQVAHAVLQEDDVIEEIAQRWGRNVLNRDGQIDRKRLGKIVFGGPDETELDHLESITHPRIRKRIQEQLTQLTTSGESVAVVLDIPLLFEGKYDEQCDHVVFVDTKLNLRQQRAKLRGWPEGELRRRESRQLPVEDKKLRSGVVIDNSGTKKATAEQLFQFWESLGHVVTRRVRDLYFKTNLDTIESELNRTPPNGNR